MGIWGKLFGKKSASTDTKPHAKIEWKHAGFDTAQFFANEMIDGMKGRRGNPKTSITLIYEDEASAVASEVTRAKGWQKHNVQLGTCAKFTDNMYAIEYLFEYYVGDNDVLKFCRVFKNSKVKSVTARDVGRTTQQKILATFGIKQGISV
jgi:hypothetical protein